MVRVRNEEVCRKAGIKMELTSRVDQKVLRWLEHEERMYECRMARKLFVNGGSGGRVRGRPRLGSIDGVTVTLGSRWMMVEAMLER